MIKPVRWVTHHAATGLKDLPRNGTWLLFKAWTAPSVVTRAAGSGITDSLRRMTRPGADALAGGDEAVEVRLKRAQVAIASAKEAERDAFADAQHVKALADVAKGAADEGEQRVSQALRDAEHEVDRRMQAARVQFAELLDKERRKARHETAKAVERVAAEVRASVDRARGVAQAAAEMARARIDSAQQQMAAARSLAAEAKAAAERVANQAHEQATAIAEDAGEPAQPVDAVVDVAHRTEGTPADETTHVVLMKTERLP
jgi:hypothetical protein